MSKDDDVNGSVDDSYIYYHNDVYGASLIARLLADSLGQRVLEVGAGAGHVTEQLAQRSNSVVALEPNRALYRDLSSRVSHLSNVAPYNMTLQEYHNQHREQQGSLGLRNFDSVLYVNVLEHISDDVAELHSATSLLSTQGNILIVVPAHQWLYSRVDWMTGHFRRYSKKRLRTVVADAGLHITSMQYFDSVGLLPYLIFYKWFKSTATSGANAVLYSRVLLPISFLIHKLTRGKLVGKNLLVKAVFSAPRRSDTTQS